MSKELELVKQISLGNGIYQLTMNDPANENRFTDPLEDQLAEAFDQVATADDLKVVILAGLSNTFSAGASLDTLRRISKNEKSIKNIVLVEKILNCPVPVVGAIEGHAIGGGLTLALACDVTVANESRRYGANFTNMGFTPGMGTTALLPLLAGHNIAAEMILTGKLYKGRELKSTRLFNYIVPAEQVMEKTLELAWRMADKPRYVLEMLKETLALPRRQLLMAARSREHLMYCICFDRAETSSFIEESYPD